LLKKLQIFHTLYLYFMQSLTVTQQNLVIAADVGKQVGREKV